jgi:hypothetical protein
MSVDKLKHLMGTSLVRYHVGYLAIPDADDE